MANKDIGGGVYGVAKKYVCRHWDRDKVFANCGTENTTFWLEHLECDMDYLL